MKKSSDEIKRCESTGKICYSERGAAEAINSARRHRCKSGGAKQIPKREYFCEKCGCFHLSHYTSYQSQTTKNYNLKRKRFLNDEAETVWRDELRNLSSYRSNRW